VLLVSKPSLFARKSLIRQLPQNPPSPLRNSIYFAHILQPIHHQRRSFRNLIVKRVFLPDVAQQRMTSRDAEEEKNAKDPERGLVNQ
jgi:hypothetical protein